MEERTYAYCREMSDKGASLREIAEVLDVSHATVRNWLKR
jgi:transposase